MQKILPKPKLRILILLLFLPYSLFSQMVATFTSNISEGCAPMAVTFVADYSGALTYYWDFDNGNVANSATAYATFNTSGVYNVELTVSNGTTSLSSTMNITVFVDPIAGFTYVGQTNNGCEPSLASILDLSIPGGGAIVSWLWDFGDGYTLSEYSSDTAYHNYIYHGDYSVSLEVTDVNGCSDVLLLNNLIHVSDLPFVSFYADMTQFCEVPGVVSFTNASTGFGSLSSNWDFGDMFTSILPNPSHSYNSYGYFDVTLTVTDAIGCSNDLLLSSYIQIDSVSAYFNLPDTICANDTITIINFSTGANMYYWDFVTSNSASFTPEVSWAQGGNYIVSLDANLNGICNDYHTDTIFVETSLAYFVPSQDYICQIPTDLTYNNQSLTNNSQGFADIEWNFELYPENGPQTPTSVFNPIITYDMDDSLAVENHWTYQSSLDVTTPFGCTAHWEDTIIVWLPHPNMLIEQNTSCVPSLVDVEDFSVYTSPYDDIVSWVWNFGNFTAPISGQYPPTQTYLDSGIFEISMVITTAVGCVATAVTSITTGFMQQASFIMLSPDTICASDSSVFMSTSTDTSIIQSYFWEYSDAHISAGEVTMSWPHDVGWIDVSLTVSHYGCNNTYSESNAFYVLGPIGWPKVTHDCDNTMLYTFKPDSTIVLGFVETDHFYWDFSDGSPIDSVNQYVQHLYTTSPIDTFIYLTLTNDLTGCVKRDSFQIHVRNPIAEFTMDTTKICPGDTVSFDPSLSQEYDYSYYAWNVQTFFIWNFDDGATFGPSDWLMPDTISNGLIKYVFNEPGEYNVRLLVSDMYGCYDTVFHSLKVYGIDPIPIIDPPSGCTPISCTFTDASTSDTTLVSWFWNFGQGSNSILQNPVDTINYTVDGSYMLYFTTSDALGCTITDSVEIVASTPVANFTINNSTICFGDTIFFTNLSTTYASSPIYFWNFGDGSSSNEFEPYHIYQQGGNYTAFLNIVDGVCTTTYTLPLTIQIQDPNTEIISSMLGTVCAPEHIMFHADPHPSYFSTMIWNLGDGTISQAEEPGHNYTQPGIYPITLKVYTSQNCTAYADTLFLNVVLVEAQMNLSEHEICLGDSIDLVIQNQLNVDGFFLDFGDGSPYGTNIVTTHTYNVASQFGYLVPTLHYWSQDSGCVEYDSDTLYIKAVRAFFDRGLNDEDTAACYSLSVDFINNAIGADQHFWSFGDGTSSWEINPTHPFNSPGNYEVGLTVTGLDCEVTETKWIYVWPPPPIDVELWNEICYGDSVQLEAQGGETYLWSPDSFLTNIFINNPIAIPPYSFDYNLHVIDTNDCANDEIVKVFVQQTPLLNLLDTTIIVGQSFDLPDSAAYNVEYFWSPNAGLFNSNSYNPVFGPLESTLYTVEMYAYANGVLCDTASADIYIEVLWEFTLDIPMAFSPNGDGVNDNVFVRGWGIRSLIDFRIYNRWGEVVFQTDDINIGWNGIYKGQLQASDTYIYDVEVETYDNRRLKKKGSINLLR